MATIEKILFYLFVFAIPFQTRKILYIWGNEFNEWTSIYLYLTDVLILSLFLLFFWRTKGERFFKIDDGFVKRSGFWLLLFFVTSFISIVRAGNLILSLYSLVKLAEMIGLFLYVKRNAGLVFNARTLAGVFVASAVFQSYIAIGQFCRQGSLGLIRLAESPLGIELAGVAKLAMGNIRMIRPYGTLPHPNVLAVFLLLALFFCIYFLFKDGSSKHIAVFSFVLIVFSFLLTFSRASLIALIIGLIFFFFTQRKDIKRVVLVLSLFAVCAGIFLLMAWPELTARFDISVRDQSLSLRVIYNEIALEAISQYPFVGLGLGNFTWHVRDALSVLSGWLQQPVHNIYLFIGAEIGLLGLVFFLMFVWRSIVESKSALMLSVLLCFLLIGLFDHHFMTIQQSQIVFWFVLGLMSSDLRP